MSSIGKLMKQAARAQQHKTRPIEKQQQYHQQLRVVIFFAGWLQRHDQAQGRQGQRIDREAS